MTDAKTAAIVAKTLRELDKDRYFASLFLPEVKRPAIQALWAFSAEVATTSERVHEPGPGEIRLQWWTDALGGTEHGAVRANPLAAALLDAIADFGLEPGPLQRLVSARRFDLYQDPMPDIVTFEGYAGETVSILYQYAAQILNDGSSVDTGDAAGHLGVAEALLGHLRAFGYNAGRARLFLPQDVFSRHEVDEKAVFAGADSKGLHTARAELLDLAKSHAGKARAALAALPRPARPAFAALALLKGRQSRLAKTADPFATPPDAADWQKLWAMFWWMGRKG